MQVIPVQAQPNQTLFAQLDGQSVQITLWTKTTGLFLDLYLAGNPTPVVSGVLCLNQVRLVRDQYLGLVGDLAFLDQSGAGEDPVYTGLGSQFALIYLEAADIAADPNV